MMNRCFSARTRYVGTYVWFEKVEFILTFYFIYFTFLLEISKKFLFRSLCKMAWKCFLRPLRGSSTIGEKLKVEPAGFSEGQHTPIWRWLKGWGGTDCLLENFEKNKDLKCLLPRSWGLILIRKSILFVCHIKPSPFQPFNRWRTRVAWEVLWPSRKNSSKQEYNWI